MLSRTVFGLLAVAIGAKACEIPDEPPLSNTITEGFGVAIQNPEFPVIHNRFLNLYEAGGGDRHLYLNPIGAYAFDITLQSGVITWHGIRAVINGEYLITDNTTKLFMTERGDPRALFQPVYGCNPDTDALQVELEFVGRQNDVPGGNVCVRTGMGTSYEFRYSPPGNPAHDPNRPCMPVTLVVDRTGPPGGIPTSSTSSAAATPTSTPATSSISTSTRSTSSTTTRITPTPTGQPDLFADVTDQGWAFVGCAPEEGPANDGHSVRTLPNDLLGFDLMTNELCVAHCGSLGYKFAGSEYSRECWCGNSYLPTRQPGTTVASLATCNMRCGGDPNQWCGGRGWLSMYAVCTAGQDCVNAEFS